MMMTLEQAIEHCEEVANSKCDQCGAEHKQLAKWLRELKARRELYKLEEKDDDLNR